MDQPEYAQPANFALQAALFDLITSWGVAPDAVVGHSIGEVSAAYASDAITLEEGVTRRSVFIDHEFSKAQRDRSHAGC